MLGCSSFNSFNRNPLDVFNKTNFPQALVGYELVIANLALCLVGYLPFPIHHALIE